MSMSKKDFVAMANAIAETRPHMTPPVFDRLVSKMVKIFVDANPKFDEARFRAACLKEGK